MGNTSRRLTRQGNRINQTYGGRYFKTILQKNNYYLNAYKYNYFNSVATGIVSRVEDYKYSTLSGLLGKSHLFIPVAEDITLFTNTLDTLKWLNTSPDQFKMEAVRYALKRPFYSVKKERNTNKPLISDDDLL